MSDLAALHEAAEALARAARHADKGDTFEAAFAAENSDLAAISAFKGDPDLLEKWREVLSVIDEELTIDGVRVA